MKILHTSDLHLGDIWRGNPRWQDQMRVLDEILALCDAHDVDMLLVAGDVFSDRVPGRHETVARNFLKRLQPHLQRGRAVFLLRGNHDPFPLFQLMSVLLQEMAGRDRWPLVVAAEPDIYSVPGHALQVVALPYVGPNWLRARAFDPEQDPDERVVNLAGMLGRQLEWLYRQADPAVPAIFTAHMTVRGASLTPEIEAESGYHREMLLERDRLPDFTSYNALGHIHLTQSVSAAKPTWYSGAPERVNLGERSYSPCVLLVTTPDTPGGEAAVRKLFLESPTPFIDEDLTGVAAVESFCARGLPDPLGELRLAGIPAAERAALEAAIRRVAPRIGIRWQRDEQPHLPDLTPRIDPLDVPRFVHSYLESEYAGRPEQRAKLAAAFDALWSEEEGAA